MNYAILPMVNFNISQGRFTGISHGTLNAYDLCGEGTTKEYFRAPCKVKLVRKYPYIKYGSPGNTLLYQSTEQVDLVNGEKSYITIAVTHCDDISKYILNKVYDTWDVIYQEGKTGNATGNHVHIEIGKGKQTYKNYDANGNWCLKNLLNIEDVFYVDSAKNKLINTYGYSFKLLPLEATKLSVDEEVTVSNGSFNGKGKISKIEGNFITLEIENAN